MYLANLVGLYWNGNIGYNDVWKNVIYVNRDIGGLTTYMPISVQDTYYSMLFP